ncbi:MAG: hypothetical protein P1U35_03850 [Cycloclasticus sp.]|nr:hypothetical protein [Cycloclasticus sp.]
MEIKKNKYCIFLNIALLSLIAIGPVAYAVFAFWDILNNHNSWLVIGVCSMPLFILIYIPKIFSKLKNKIILTDKGVIFEDSSNILILWNEITSIKLKKVRLSPRARKIVVVVIIMNEESSFYTNYWKNIKLFKNLNSRYFGEGTPISVECYEKRPEEIYSIIDQRLTNASSTTR